MEHPNSKLILIMTMVMMTSRKTIATRPTRTCCCAMTFVLLASTLLLLVVPTTASAAANSNTDDDVVRCITEWGVDNTDDTSNNALMKVLPASHVNDGYCDCIYSGIDETNTSACSGMLVHQHRPSTNTPSPTTKKLLFTCPIEQQPIIQLPMSRVNDGICDCCDGADERVVTTTTTTTTTGTITNPCVDNCAAIIEQQRQFRNKLQRQYTEGRQVRSTMIQQYQTMIANTKKQIKQVRHTKQQRTTTMESYYIRNLFTAQFQYNNHHLSRILQSMYTYLMTPTKTNDDATKSFSFVHLLSKEEIERIIVSICQLYGEMIHEEKKDQSMKTCIPIRLAAMELGDIFVDGKENNDRLNFNSDNNNSDGRTTTTTTSSTTGDIQFRRIIEERTSTSEMAIMMATILDYNSNVENIQDYIWNMEDYRQYTQYVDRSMKSSSSLKKSVKRKTQYNREDYEDEDYEEDYYDDENDDDDYHSNNHMDTTTAPFRPSHSVDDFLYMNYQQRDRMKSSLLKDPLYQWMYEYRQRYVQHVQETILTSIDRQLQEHEEKVATKTKPNDDTAEDPELVLADEELMTDTKTSEIENERMESLTKIKSTLQSHIQSIQYGYEIAMSGQYLLQSITKESMTSIEEARFSDRGTAIVNDIELTHYQYVQKLLFGAIYYSQLPYYTIYEIFLNTLSNTSSSSSSTISNGNTDEQTCIVPYSHLCPPQTMFRNDTETNSGNQISVPQILYNDMISFCNDRFKKNAEGMDDAASSSSCLATIALSSTESIPTTLSGGDYGYYPTTKRNDENDVLHKLFGQVYGSDVSLYGTEEEMKAKKEMNDLQDIIANMTKAIHEMEKTLNELEAMLDENSTSESTTDTDIFEDSNDTIELPKYGVDGELYSIKDQCFDFVQGKYKYEVCLYQCATQSDIGDESSGGGTSLGQWNGAFMETVTDGNTNRNSKERIWKWTNGAQCWNGPQRSITAHVNQCGPVTKIISANEPDTCRYVLVVESPIVCDNAYQQRYGLAE